MEEMTSEMFCKTSGIFQVERGRKISQTERHGVFGNAKYLLGLGWVIGRELSQGPFEPPIPPLAFRPFELPEVSVMVW